LQVVAGRFRVKQSQVVHSFSRIASSLLLVATLAACGSDGSESPAETTPVTEAVVATTMAAVAVPPTTAAVTYANCDEVKAAGAAPIHAGDPGYNTDLDRDGDGVACET
jgi:hypothetical protein